MPKLAYRRALLFLILLSGIVITHIVVGQLNGDKIEEFQSKVYDPVSLEDLHGFLYITSNYVKYSGNDSNNDAYIMILDNKLKPVWSQRLSKPYKMANDFKKHPDGRYSYWRGKTIYDKGEFVILDTNKEVENIVKIKNYAHTDGHELIIKPNGNFLLLSYDKDEDLKQLNVIIQEQNAQGVVVWEWNSKNYFTKEMSTYLELPQTIPSQNYLDQIHMSFNKLSDYEYLYNKIVATSSYVDIVHSNSIFVCEDGNILISSRHLNTVTKINYETGGIIWNLGGAKSKINQFQFINDTMGGFSCQHDARFLENGNLLLFDNGNLNNPQFSRAVEYRLDENNKTAELVWEYKNVTQVGYTYGFACGSVQKLPGGLVLIGWGITRNYGVQEPAFSIVKYNQEKVADFFMPIRGQYTYRVRFADSQ